MRHLFLVHFVLLITATQARAQDMVWQRAFGGPGLDVATDVTMTSDGGFLVVGATNSDLARPDAELSGYVVKTDAYGELRWARSFSNYHVALPNIVVARNGEILLLGSARPTAEDVFRGWSARLNDTGGLISEQIYFDIAGTIDEVRRTRDGGFVMVANGSLVARFDSEARLLWTRAFETDPYLSYGHVSETSDGGFIVSSMNPTNAGFQWGMMALRLDAQGDSLWRRNVGMQNANKGVGIMQTWSGGYLMAASPATGGSSNLHVYMTDLDSNGYPLSTYSIDKDSVSTLNWMESKADGNFLMVGTAMNESNVAYVVEVDNKGRPLWSDTYPLPDSLYSSQGWMIHSVDDGYIVAGTAIAFDSQIGPHSQMYLLRIGGIGLSVDEDRRELPKRMNLR